MRSIYCEITSSVHSMVKAWVVLHDTGIQRIANPQTFESRFRQMREPGLLNLQKARSSSIRPKDIHAWLFSVVIRSLTSSPVAPPIATKLCGHLSRSTE